MKDLIQDAINDQIRTEFESAYTYLAMAATMEANNLKGFGNWLRIQWDEEVGHAMRFYDFVLHRGGDVELKALDKPVSDSEAALPILPDLQVASGTRTSRQNSSVHFTRRSSHISCVFPLANSIPSSIMVASRCLSSQ